MDIRAQLTNDMKDAMRAKDQIKLESIRFLQSAIKNREIEMRPDAITGDDVVNVIKKMVKQRKESIDQFQTAGRQDLVDKETAELKILENYLPAQMSKDVLEKICNVGIQIELDALRHIDCAKLSSEMRYATRWQPQRNRSLTRDLGAQTHSSLNRLSSSLPLVRLVGIGGGKRRCQSS